MQGAGKISCGYNEWAGAVGVGNDRYWDFVNSFCHSDCKKATSASRSLWLSWRTNSRAGSASPPWNMIASISVRARPSCRYAGMPLTVAVRPMPHSGGVRHSRPSASKSGRSSANSSPMSCNSRSV